MVPALNSYLQRAVQPYGVLVAAVLLSTAAGIAGAGEQDVFASCSLDPKGWELLPEPPTDARDLLSLPLGLGTVRSSLFDRRKHFREAWFRKDDDTLAVCAYRRRDRTCSDIGDTVTFVRGRLKRSDGLETIQICDPKRRFWRLRQLFHREERE